jgi:hypothetical protein
VWTRSGTPYIAAAQGARVYKEIENLQEKKKLEQLTETSKYLTAQRNSLAPVKSCVIATNNVAAWIIWCCAL